VTPTSYPVSIVIPTYRRRASVQRALEALISQTVSPGDYEVVVSIDGSEDGTREMVAAFSAPYDLRALWQPNKGRAAACNAGIRAARGELIVLLDDDMEAHPGFVAGHRQAHSAGSRLGVIGAAPVPLDTSASPVRTYVGSKFNHHLEVLAQPNYVLKLRDFYSGNFSIRRSLLLEVGCFDEDFRMYGNEDLELSLRLLRAGVRFAYSAEAMATQHYTKSFADLARDTIAKGRTAVLLVHKHPETVRDLKLSAYADASRPWRLLRRTLLWCSSHWTGTARLVMWAGEWFGQRRPRWLPVFYALALDYCYWLGALSADGGDPKQPPAWWSW